MEEFVANKSSWHYWLNRRMSKGGVIDEYNVDQYIQNHKDLCSYFWLTARSVFMVALNITFAISGFGILGLVLILLVMGIMNAPLNAALLVGTVLIIIALVVVAAWLYECSQERKRERVKGLIKSRYSSWKQGICTPVRFE